jgi:hypothetical protein
VLNFVEMLLFEMPKLKEITKEKESKKIYIGGNPN